MIRHAWKKCDIVSFDFDVVINLIKTKKAARLIAQRSTTSSLDSYSCLQRTSKRSQSLKKNVEALRTHYEEFDNFNVEAQQMFRYIKDIETQINTLKLHTRDLNACTTVFVKRAQRDDYTEIVAATSDVMYIDDCRALHSERAKKKKKKIDRKVKRDVAKRRKIAKQLARDTTASRVNEIETSRMTELKFAEWERQMQLKIEAFLPLKELVDEEDYQSLYSYMPSSAQWCINCCCNRHRFRPSNARSNHVFTASIAA